MATQRSTNSSTLTFCSPACGNFVLAVRMARYSCTIERAECIQLVIDAEECRSDWVTEAEDGAVAVGVQAGVTGRDTLRRWKGEGHRTPFLRTRARK